MLGLQNLLDSRSRNLSDIPDIQRRLCPSAFEHFDFKLECRLPWSNETRNFLRSHDQSNMAREHRPWVFINCGHVVTEAMQQEQGNNNRCPKCQLEGGQVRLLIGMEPSFWREANPRPTHFFTNCGHVITESAGEFWFHLHLVRDVLGPVCPFCAKPLPSFQPYNRLVFD